MAVGTAGFTAMLAVMALERHGLRPGAGDVLVTGAAGGVGSVATRCCRASDTGSSRRPAARSLRDYLEGLGAADLIERSALATTPPRPLDSERWAGAVDAVGGATLATVLTQLKYRASVAACGLAGGTDLPTTVIPFLLRGVNLLGIDSVMCPRERTHRSLASAGVRPAARPPRPNDRDRPARGLAGPRAEDFEGRGARSHRRRRESLKRRELSRWPGVGAA